MAYDANVTYTSDLINLTRDVWSQLILFEAQPVLRFDQFAVISQDLMVSAGGKVKVPKYGSLEGPSGPLSENQEIQAQKLSAGVVEVTVDEWGNAIAVTEKLLQQSFTTVMKDAAKLLGMNYAETLDRLLRDTVLGCTNVFYGYDASGSQATSRDTITSDHKFTTALVRDAVELLKTNNTPLVDGEWYVCFLHPHQARQLREDEDWKYAARFGDTERIFRGQIGIYENVVFIETSHMPVLEGSGYNSADVYQAVMFGAYAYCHAIALPVELRDNGVEDFGRIHKLAWYSIMGAAILNDDYIVRLETG